MRDEQLQRPTNDDRDAWRTYWTAQGTPWRTEPEISEERQAYLTGCRSVTPDIEAGLYPFRDENGSIKLDRADVEWLLATHEDGRGPVRWEEEKDKAADEQRWGLDLRGADLREAKLSRLPLASTRAGLTYYEAFGLTDEPWSVPPEQREWAAAHQVTLQQREWAVAHLEGSGLTAARLEGASLLQAHLERASLLEAHLERASLIEAYLQGTTLRRAHLEGTNLRGAHLEGKRTTSEQVQHVAQRAQYFPDVLEPADLRGAYFSPATYLGWATFGDEAYGFVALAGVRWGGVDMSGVTWERQPGTGRRRLQAVVLGDEREARQPKDDAGKPKDANRRLAEFEGAVRANRQLATALRDQGLNENADHFAYCAQRLQRQVLRRQRRPLRALFSAFLDALAGHGYKPERTLIAYLFAIGSFAVAYFVLGQAVGPHLSPLGAFVFSTTSFHGRGFFPGGIALDDPITVLAAFEAFVGLVIEVSFIATFTQRFFAR